MNSKVPLPASAGGRIDPLPRQGVGDAIGQGSGLGPGRFSSEADAVLRAAPVTFGRVDPPVTSGERTGRMRGILARARSAIETFDRVTHRTEACGLRIGYPPFDTELDVVAAAPGNLRLIDGTAPIRITDIWFAESHKLRFRVEKTQFELTGAVSFRFYQHDVYSPASGEKSGDLRLVAEAAVEPSELAFVSADLINGLDPLLIVALTHDDRLLAVDLLAFPSLCRGGLHSAELKAAVSSGDYLLDLQSLADTLTLALLDLPDPPNLVGRVVEIDPREALGSEPIFRSDVASWLSRIFKTQLRLGRSAADGEPDHARHRPFRNLIAADEALAGDVGDATLRLPARALPTISYLVEASTQRGAGSDIAPYLVADGATNDGRWYVGIPPIAPWLEDVQFRAGQPEFPMQAKGGEPQSSVRPAAILYTMPAKGADQSRTFPIAPDYPGPIFGDAAALDVERPLTVVVHTLSERDSLDRTLRSLSRQLGAENFSVILFDPFSIGADAFGAPQAVSSMPDLLRHLENEAAEGDRLLLFVSSRITLHDIRTAAMLARMAALPRVASAGCMQIDAKLGPRNAMEFRSAGLFPDRIEFLAHPTVLFSQPNCEECLPRMTYPVAGNSMDLLMVQARTWLDLVRESPLSSGNPFAAAQALAYAAHALRRRHIHLCTTLVSAFHGGVKTQGTFTGLPVRDALPFRDLVDSLDEVTIIRRL